MACRECISISQGRETREVKLIVNRGIFRLEGEEFSSKEDEVEKYGVVAFLKLEVTGSEAVYSLAPHVSMHLLTSCCGGTGPTLSPEGKLDFSCSHPICFLLAKAGFPETSSLKNSGGDRGL